MSQADRLVLSFPDELSDWGRQQVFTERYENYLRRMFDAPAVGDEFVDVGCCGDSLDITFRVEAKEGGETVGDDTAIEFVERQEAMEGGWHVQSAAAPE